VSDEGPGLPQDVRRNLFQPTASTKPGGSGLGLAITRRLAVSIGGEVALESTGPQGTVFVLRLPPVAV
jgi:hypothetical protein